MVFAPPKVHFTNYTLSSSYLALALALAFALKIGQKLSFSGQKASNIAASNSNTIAFGFRLSY